MIEKTIVILKPECFTCPILDIRSVIMREIGALGLKIVQKWTVTLNSDVIHQIHPSDCSQNPSLDMEYKRLMEEYLSGKQVNVLVVTGDSAAIKLRDMCGKRKCPRKCDAETWRYRFGYMWKDDSGAPFSGGALIGKDDVIVYRNHVTVSSRGDEFMRFEDLLLKNPEVVKFRS